jgi:hypothetical protein
MLLRTIWKLSFFTIITLLFTACTSFSISFSTAPLSNYSVDNSFPVNADPVEINNIASVLEYSWIKSKKPVPAANILLKGQIVVYGTRTKEFLPVVKLKYRNDADIHLLSLPPCHQKYSWKGKVTIDGYSMDVTVSFDAYGNEDGSGKTFILKNAVLGQTKLVFEDPIDNLGLDGNLPFLMGYVHIANSKYRLYAVMDNSPNRQPFNRDVFFNPLQKFQFINEKDQVITELEQGIYKIYNNVPTAEKSDLKNAIALFVAFKHSTSVLSSINNGKETELFYQYDFP